MLEAEVQNKVSGKKKDGSQKSILEKIREYTNPEKSKSKK